RHSERLATIGRVAAGVAHELGAPLNVIDGRAERLLTHPNVQLETRQRNLTIIRAQANRIKRIVRQLLNIVRPHDIRFAPVSAAQLINTTVELIEGEAKSAGISVEVASEESVRINADEGLLQQVLLNICFNAIQAMPSGGCLRIECLDGEMAEPERRFVGIRISDTGGGIAPESLSHIFEPFYTTKEAEGGTGLGLTISRRIVEQHGGWIEAANKDEGGAIFTIWLQRCEQESRNPVDGNVEERIDHHESAIAGN
ncbi:MAG TPA: ATP-binding protein, partial [Blastocatellia bacterium]|nr:ATP-binding protein [Blastocatellia bacterium]